MKTLNEARHQALEDLKEKLLQKYRRNVGDERVKRIAEETPAKISAIAACDNVPRKKEEYIPVYVSCESEEASEVLCQKDLTMERKCTFLFLILQEKIHRKVIWSR